MNQHAKRRAAAAVRALPDEPQARAPRPAAPTAPQVSGARGFDVAAEQAGMRIDRFLVAAVEAGSESLSRSRLKALIEAGQVRAGGAPVTDAAQRVSAGARIEIDVPPPVEAEPLGETIPLTIVYEDDHLIVIDKPAGLVVHPGAGNETGTLVNALIAHCGATLSGIGGVRRPGIVHRLDKDTSGLIVAAKTDAAHQGLSALFADHGRTGSLLREYTALVWGRPARLAGHVDAPIGRHPAHRERMAVVKPAKGREAVTHWRVLGNLGAATLVACRLETGRTHQIRVHMAHLGHPLLGDQVYALGFKTKASLLGAPAQAALTALNRQALHASLLGFEHPVTGEALRFESALPEDLARLAQALREV